MKISVITVCFNSDQTIEKTIQSVINQDYNDIEYIVVDGNSKDKTLSIIDKYKNRISKFISEKDEGIYFAINKGLQIASGEIIAILHADDFYANEKIISSIMNLFIHHKTDTVYGDLQYVDRTKTSKIIRNWKAGEYVKSNFLNGWMPPHPSFFIRKSCYQKFGFYNTTLKSAADYELMLRLLYKNNCSVKYIPQVLVKMRVGGKSNLSLLNRFKANREDKQAWLINDLKPKKLTFILKPLSKINQFLK